MPSAPAAHRIGRRCGHRCRRSRPAAAPFNARTALSPAAPTGIAGIGLGRRGGERCRGRRSRRLADRGPGPARPDRARRRESRSGPSSARAASAGRSLWPTWQPAAPAASATSTRSLTISGTPSGSSSAFKRARLLEQRPAARVLVAQLDQRHAAPTAAADHVDHVAAAGDLRIGHQVKRRVEAEPCHAIRTPSRKIASIERGELVDDLPAQRPRPRRAHRRPLAREAEDRKPLGRGRQRVGLDHEKRTDHRARRAAERRHPGHSDIAIAHPAASARRR